MTELEKKLMAMSPAERKKAGEFIDSQMGVAPKDRRKSTSTTKKKSGTNSKKKR